MNHTIARTIGPKHRRFEQNTAHQDIGVDVTNQDVDRLSILWLSVIAERRLFTWVPETYPTPESIKFDRMSFGEEWMTTTAEFERLRSNKQEQYNNQQTAMNHDSLNKSIERVPQDE